jgi:carboxypeptidase C (cathepsin A)
MIFHHVIITLLSSSHHVIITTGKPDDVHSLHKAGYAVTYDSFQFITVNGAGHMVPQFQPGFAKSMFEKFLADETF